MRRPEERVLLLVYLSGHSACSRGKGWEPARLRVEFNTRDLDHTNTRNMGVFSLHYSIYLNSFPSWRGQKESGAFVFLAESDRCSSFAEFKGVTDQDTAAKQAFF
jgi:hypothetical protein